MCLFLLVTGCVPHTTDSTEVGVRTKKFAFIGEKGVEDKIYAPGSTYFFLPFINDWHTFDTKLQNLEMKRHYVSDKFIVGIDPAKHKHQAMVLDPKGIPVGNSFSFTNSYNGFHFKLWQKLKSLSFEVSTENTAFAIEISINYWQKLCHYLNQKGYTVLMVRPITTKHERPRLNNFSRTDHKDALCIASSARQGYFNFY